MKKNIYHRAPLPFQGQKRYILRKVKEVLKQFPDDATYVDLFGGSGLLSHTIKQEKPRARVIWNDFDNYQKRLENIHQTNKILAEIQPFFSGLSTNERVPEPTKMAIIKIL